VVLLINLGEILDILLGVIVLMMLISRSSGVVLELEVIFVVNGEEGFTVVFFIKEEFFDIWLIVEHSSSIKLVCLLICVVSGLG